MKEERAAKLRLLFMYVHMYLAASCSSSRGL